jgi:ABC-type uncharacterized transport system permease subunit
MSLIPIDGLTKHFKIHRVCGFPSLPLFLRPEEVAPLVYFSPVVGIGLFTITCWIWTKAVNAYTGTGS